MTKKAKKVRTKATGSNPCQCGCGALVAKRFKAGHDAKLKSALIRSAMLGDDPDAEKELARLGWTKFLDKARASSARRSAPKNVQRQQTAADRQERASQRIELLEQMKAARDALREHGRSPEIQVSRKNWQAILDDPAGYNYGDENR